MTDLPGTPHGGLAVEMSGIAKSFDGTKVLLDVDFEVRAGEVHALAGGNGAGKSTLMKILQGVYTMDRGEIRVDGRLVRLSSVLDAQAAGIGMVFQEFSLVPSLSVAQNIFLNAESRRGGTFLRDRDSERRAQRVLAQMGAEIDPGAPVGQLGTAYWQLTEIAKALAKDARVLIMDEPTASLARHEADALFELVGRLKQQGIAIIYISHRMQEIYQIADRISVLRDGRRLFTERIEDVTPAKVVEGIVGHSMEEQLAYHVRPPRNAEVILSVRHLSARPRLVDVSFDVKAGEIIGLAGLMGSGRTELAQCLFGVARAGGGDVLVRDQPVHLSHSSDAIAAGLALIPEDRRKQGLVLEHSVRDNLLLGLLPTIRRGGVFVDSGKGRRLADRLIERFGVKAGNPGRPVRLLSGGNQQKVVLAKWLGTEPDILIMDEPTAGVDIGTKSDILDQIRGLANAGKAIILISSEYAELLAVADRVLVLRDGVIAQELTRAEIPDEESLQLAVQGVQPS